MAKLVTSDLSSLSNQTTAISTINSNFNAVDTAMENTLSRDGTSPNAMGAQLDMNSNKIINLPDALTDQEPATLSQLTAQINALHDTLFDELIDSTDGIIDFSSHAAALLATISTSAAYIRTAGYWTAGDSGGALYKKVVDTGELLPWQFRSNNNTLRWQLVPNSDGSISTKQLGAKHDWNGTTGTDDTAAIQAAIDFSTYGGAKCKVFLSPGACKTTDTIHLGYGDNLVMIHFEGVGPAINAEPAFNYLSHSSINLQASDRPTIAVTNARHVTIKNISSRGLNWHQIQDNALGSTSQALDSLNSSNWVASSLHTNADSRYAPYACIAIDPYHGSAPTPSYPNVTFPSYTGITTQYDKSASSVVIIEDCTIAGFIVGLVIQPGNSDGNGDFTRLRNCDFSQCKYGVSVGQTQSRQVDLDNVDFNQVFTVLTNSTHGKQLGAFGGHIRNLGIGNSIHIFDFGSLSTVQGIEFVNLYAENLWRLGRISASSAVETSLRFVSSHINFYTVGETVGIPGWFLDDTGGTSSNIEFVNCFLGTYGNVFTCRPSSTRFKGSILVPTDQLVSAYEYSASHGTAGGLMISNGGGVAKQQDLRFTTRSLAGALGVDEISNGEYQSNRSRPIPWWSTYASALDNAFDRIRCPWGVRFILNMSDFSSITLVGRTLTGTFTARSDNTFITAGPLPGDVIMDPVTGSVFWVYSRIGTTIIAKLQNNYKSNGMGGYTILSSINLASGNFNCYPTRYYSPSSPIVATISTGSAVITDAARADGYAAFIQTEIQANDNIMIDQLVDFYHSDGNLVVASDNTAKTITMTSQAQYTASRKRLMFWRRVAPANI